MNVSRLPISVLPNALGIDRLKSRPIARGHGLVRRNGPWPPTAVNPPWERLWGNGGNTHPRSEGRAWLWFFRRKQFPHRLKINFNLVRQVYFPHNRLQRLCKNG